MLSYIYMRNLTPLMRTRYLEPLHSLGKITLETYLMQHHIWLTSNAKTLLVVIPGQPKLNMVVVTVSYVLMSRELYRLTMSLRGMCLPDDLSACLRNLAGIAAVLVSATGVAKGLLLVGAGPAACLAVIGAVGFGAALAVHAILASARLGGGGGGGRGGWGGGGGVMSLNGRSTPTGVLADDHDGKPAGKKEYDGRLLHAYHTVSLARRVCLCFVFRVVACLFFKGGGKCAVSSPVEVEGAGRGGAGRRW